MGNVVHVDCHVVLIALLGMIGKNTSGTMLTVNCRFNVCYCNDYKQATSSKYYLSTIEAEMAIMQPYDLVSLLFGFALLGIYTIIDYDSCSNRIVWLHLL